MSARKPSNNIFLKMHPLHRVLISLLLCGIAYLFIRNSNLSSLVRLILMWDVFAFSYIITSWIVFFKRSTVEIRQVATREDGSSLYVFFVIVLASFASMITVLMLIISKDAAKTSEAIYLPVAIAGMLLSWYMVHTTFAFHYAHLYYDDDNNHADKCLEGLNFPGEKNPDYLDFAYFSFVVGMTFQVSDVEISSKTIRRLALMHSLLSFGLNTFVVALTINIIAGLKS
jgi:uncharacterized membrane protein